MTLTDAERIVNRFGSVLAGETQNDGPASCESSLPNSREEIVQAMKLWLANEIKNNTLTEEFKNVVGTAAARLPHFFPDFEALRMNSILKQARATLNDRKTITDRSQIELLQSSAEVHELLQQAHVAGCNIIETRIIG